MKHKYLMTPGPSPVPAQVREVLGQDIIHHRTEGFRSILKFVHEGLKKIFCTDNPVLVLASSGTGAMEASVCNLFSTKDTVVAICGGKFGERWSEIGKSFGLNVIEMNVEWGTSPSISKLKEILDQNPEVKGVLTTLSETSTATVFDIENIAKVVKSKNVLLVVDAISGLGQDVLKTDQWGIDVVVSGSQKGLMLPPGLAFISVSKQAQEAMQKSNLPKYYFDLKEALKTYAKDDTPYTPAVSLIIALKTSLELLLEEGIENRWNKYKKMALAVQEGAKVLGLEVYSKSPSYSVTAICVPKNLKASDIVKKIKQDFGITTTGGQDDIKEKVVRIAHMGWINELDIVMCFSVLEKVLKDLGHTVKLGASLTKIQEVLYA